MNKNKLVLRFVSISFSVLVILLVLIGFVKVGTYCYDFGYRIFTEEAIDEEPGRDVVVQITDDMSGMDIAKECLIFYNNVFPRGISLLIFSGLSQINY